MFEKLENGQILKVEKNEKYIVKKAFGMEYQYLFNNDGELIETKKFNLVTGEYEHYNSKEVR